VGSVSAEIIEQIRNSSEKAFRVVYDHYFLRLERFAAGYVIDRVEAQDIVQSVFLTLWDRKESLYPGTNLQNYLITLTKNQCLNYLRHIRAQLNYQTRQEKRNAELLLNYYALEKLNENKLLFDELEIAAKQAIDSLPGQSREVFILSRIEGMKYQEIALRLEISVKTVEKKMSIALELLRDALKDYYMLLFPFLL
jgi:RNA polymerase sigma-70 factor, ECF subfamily